MKWNEYFSVDATTGILTWKERPRSHFATERGMKQTNAREAGTLAGANNGSGYLQIRIRPRAYYVHRIVWEMLNGPIPEGIEIDHRNGIRSDNTPSNLRLATPSQNLCNKSCRPNKTGFKGVYQFRERYVSRISCNGKTHSLGSYSSAEDAHRAYCEAASKLHGQFTHR